MTYSLPSLHPADLLLVTGKLLKHHLSGGLNVSMNQNPYLLRCRCSSTLQASEGVQCTLYRHGHHGHWIWIVWRPIIIVICNHGACRRNTMQQDCLWQWSDTWKMSKSLMVTCFRHFQKVLSLRSYKQLKWPESYSFVHNGRLKTCFLAFITCPTWSTFIYMLQKYKIDNSRFWNIFPDFVPPSFMVGGGYFGVRRTAEYDGCFEPNSWMQLNSLRILSGPQNSFPLPTNFKTPHPQPTPSI